MDLGLERLVAWECASRERANLSKIALLASSRIQVPDGQAQPPAFLGEERRWRVSSIGYRLVRDASRQARLFFTLPGVRLMGRATVRAPAP